ncbi:sodium:solute symporter family protein [Archaeoglobus fulgidus]|uniref:Na+/proline symporter n=2 Tax=Archaeoglobus fulgidus TaxID=2234 RepID=A0A075WG88_ARCFL|nr:sodium:solute symporter [Archaeoglobus fulgidus]AIG98079.1 Na+/proline symporter [Archaeoglobus fulgidus DSM 8774]KUJ93673.1 MAG: Pantothenate permease (PanF-2) [Archaeoglobus fulgidus]KUK06136.1 MAG: Pantothenate permease (PanF-2) [Archaeoglobus fulgidus]
MEARWDILIPVLVYFLVTTLGVGFYLMKRMEKSEEDYLVAKRGLGAVPVGVTLALTVLGTPHILGVMESAYDIGLPAVWFSFAHAIMLAIVCLFTGRWARKLKVESVPEFLDVIFSNYWLRLMVGAVIAGAIFGICTLETQGLGVFVSILTGTSIEVGIVIGALIGILYVVLSGMKEVAWLNVLNAVILYIGIIAATFVLGSGLQNGWEGVNEFYISNDLAGKLNIFGSWEVFVGFALVNVLATVFFQGISQQGLHAALAAKSPDVLRKAMLIAVPVNGSFAVFAAVMGMAARATPEFAELGAKTATPAMIVSVLPTWASALLLATCLVAVLSSYAITLLAPTTIFVNDIYKAVLKPNASHEELLRLSRILTVLLAVAALIPAVSLPPILAAMMWLFSWLVPVFWFVIFGLFWKRSAPAAIITCLLVWVTINAWTMTPLPEVLGAPGWLHQVYLALIVTLVIGSLLNAVLPGKPGLFREKALAVRG